MGARSPRATIIEPVSPPPSAGLSPRARRGRAFRILLVEPDARFQSALGAGLAEAGFEVLVVATAEDALLELAQGQPPHLVIVEAALEGMDGFTFCGQLRAETRTALVPVLLLASRRESFHPELATTMGADDYLPKPVEVRDVVALARLKAGRRSSTSYEAHSARLSLGHIAHALLLGGRSGRVVLKDCEGFFAFRNGLVVDAAFQGEHGVTAFRRLLAFGSGVYTVTYGPELHRGSLLMDLPFLREQVLPALERFERLREVGVPLAARLAVDFPRLAEHLPTLPDEILALVRLFDGRRMVRAVLLECRFTEVVAYEAVTRLFALGVLVPAAHVEERERPKDLSAFLESSVADALIEAHEAEEREEAARKAEEQEAASREAEARVLEEQARQVLAAEASGSASPESPDEELPITVEEELPITVDEDFQVFAEGRAASREEAARAGEGPSRPRVPVILFFPKRPARRWSDVPQANLVPLVPGAEAEVPLSADKV